MPVGTVHCGAISEDYYNIPYQLSECRQGIEHSVLQFLPLWIGKGNYNAYLPGLLTY